MRGISRQKNYVQLIVKGSEMAQVLESSSARVLLGMRRAELQLYTSVVAARASGYAVPVLRLSPAINHIRSQLGDLARCVAGRAPRKRMKLSKLAKQAGASFRSSIASSLLHVVEDLPSHAAVKLITDAPLELLPIRNLPMGLRFVCTRIPVTPGNLLSSVALTCRPLLLEVGDLSRVLIISAFQPADPLRGMLRASVSRYMERTARKLNIEWAEVDGLDSFRKVLNSFDGHIMIFDGHGIYSRDLGQGRLLLGRDAVDVWSLKHQVQVPPIVILSACETHPMDGTHSTVANAFLMLGAHSVLGSLVPLDGRHAAILAGRLMLRLALYLPEVEGTPLFPLRWSEIVTGMLRMSYVTDMLVGLQKAGWQCLTEERRASIQRSANDLINYLHPSWFEKVLELIADVNGTSFSEVQEAHLTHAYFSDSLYYVHLGNAEEIMVVRSKERDMKDMATT